MNIVSRLNESGLSQEEIEEYFLTYFGQSSHNNKTVIYSSYSGKSIEFIYARTGRIENIRNINISEKEINLIISDIQNINQNSKIKIGRKILYSRVQITGGYNIANIAQILPVPTQAPKIESCIYGAHPFILEYKYQGTNNITIDIARKMRKMHELNGFLQLFIPALVSASKGCGGEWFLRAGQNESDFGSAGYSSRYLDLTDRDAFENYAHDIIELEEHNKYYANGGYNDEFKFRLPDIIEESILKYSNINGKKRDQYYRAVEWFSISQELFSGYNSASFIALISAIECLMDSRPLASCETCGRPVDNVTQRFMDLVHCFAPGWFHQEQLRELYRIRSSLVHGGEIKLQRILFASGNNSVRTQHMHRRLSAGVRAVCINWLHRLQPA